MPSHLRIDTSNNVLGGPSSGCSLSSNFTPVSARSFRSISSASALSSASAASRKLTERSASSKGGVTVSYASCSPAQSDDEDDDGAYEYVLAMHDFVPQAQNVTCLAFRAGQVIRVLNRDPSGWWDGELDGRRGWFPSNYVSSDVGLLTDEELPKTKRPQSRHAASVSVASAASWATGVSSAPAHSQSFARTDHRPIPGGRDGGDPYCPPLMVPLLHGLSLLQNAAKTLRAAHFQPSTAYIISCVRAILSDVGCLPRDAPVLRHHGILAQERKRILSDLASLVSQAKRASDDTTNEDLRELEVQAMVRLGGQLFAHVRGFLALLVQCDASLPVQGVRMPGSPLGIPREGQWLSSDDTAVHSNDTGAKNNGHQAKGALSKPRSGSEHRPAARKAALPTKSKPFRAKSLGDLKAHKQTAIDADVTQMPLGPHHESLPAKGANRFSVAYPSKQLAEDAAARRKAGHRSISSGSSSSSLSSEYSVALATPSTPAFPAGPATIAEVMEVLKYTHDHYLSTIAAFIGHVHSYSRSSHASSTGHMYDLVREVVDMVCKLLTIVDAVLKHPGIPSQKAELLKVAKETLFSITSRLADSVRLLTMPAAPDLNEERERDALLKAATGTLKAGSDCVAAVKKCLQRSTGQKPFIIRLPLIGDSTLSCSPRKFSSQEVSHGRRPSKASSMYDLRERYVAKDVKGDEEDVVLEVKEKSVADATVKVDGQSTDLQSQPDLPNPWQTSEMDELTSPRFRSSVEDKPLPPLEICTQHVPPDLLSPASLAQTDDDRTTWEGSQQWSHSPMSFEEKLVNGSLPAVPDQNVPEVARSTTVAWTLSHDHAADDVAYNSEGQLVGATLAALVERMTPHDTLVEPSFAAVFFMTFRLFTTPAELLEVIIVRYNTAPPPGLPEANVRFWQQRKGLPVRLRVHNFIKAWLEIHWRPETDNVVLPTLLNFTHEGLSFMFPHPAQRIFELIGQWQMKGGETAASTKVERVSNVGIPTIPHTVPPSEAPRPVITKALLNALKNGNFGSVFITDFDALELARQLTTVESALYCAIRPEEILEMGQENATYPVNVKAVTSLSTAITGFVAESILNESDTKKRTALVKYFIKVADRCVSLNNFSTPRSILAALDSSTISRLQQTWMGLPQKNRMQLEALRKLADHARNYFHYRSRLRNTAPPAVPFLGLYLTDVTFCREGNPSFRTSPKSADKKLLNFNKYHKLARIVQDMQRFQSPYNLKPILEVQEYLRDAFEKSSRRGDLQDLYRRSLLIEPKQPADTPPTSDVRQLFNWASRSQSNHPTPTPMS
ncbi:ras GEF [Laetiporus sulphureus 93-53]|uniref:Ras GEF n=1 Tax=Laetiporus sulphureus 93-53 TaxID=1314785 RepID=A0A165HLP8_9APHY|nr:ras GEF [Laetiporus sulphureus 93-53]KZT11896.1 ras GEF [Laetiporus sulphureus 93-53]